MRGRTLLSARNFFKTNFAAAFLRFAPPPNAATFAT
jgi:hypothetical protein